MTLNSEREEVVDFVAPYFEQSGISIILREPVRPRSLFKFMEVLRYEVWTAILAAIIGKSIIQFKILPLEGNTKKIQLIMEGCKKVPTTGSGRYLLIFSTSEAYIVAIHTSLWSF